MFHRGSFETMTMHDADGCCTWLLTMKLVVGMVTEDEGDGGAWLLETKLVLENEGTLSGRS